MVSAFSAECCDDVLRSWTWIADCGNRCDGTGHLGSVLLRSILCCDPRPGSSCDSVVTPFARLSGLMVAAARGLSLAFAAVDSLAVILRAPSSQHSAENAPSIRERRTRPPQIAQVRFARR